MVSRHYENKRAHREKFIDEYLGGDGKIVDSFIVDKRHPMGAEIHEVRDNGLIIIFNKNSGKLCTKLLARKNQIQRLYQGVGKQAPKWLLELAEEHEKLGYNNI